MDNVMGIPYFILFMIRDIPIVIYEILARMKNHIDTKSFGYLSVWAYGFPLGLFATSTIKLEAVTKIVFLGYIFLFIWIVLILLWFYALLNTYIFVHRMDRNMNRKKNMPSPIKTRKYMVWAILP